MAIINLKKREVQAKIVYYGPGRGGKTTNLEYLYKKFKDRIKTEMVTIKTHGDRTLFFDFLPIEIGKIKGFDIRIQLYTVPGQVKYDATRRLVLRGADGIVFVADSLAVRRKENLLSLKNLADNLASYKKSIFDILTDYIIFSASIFYMLAVSAVRRLTVPFCTPAIPHSCEKDQSFIKNAPSLPSVTTWPK